MTAKTFLLSLIIPLTCLQLTAQNKLQSCLVSDMRTGSQEQLNTLTQSLLMGMNKGRFYLVGESHTFLANNDFQLALIKALHKDSVYNIINELPHAVCFVFNEYLETGNDSLLNTLIPAASYQLLKDVRAFNLTQPAHQRIKYYGIDYLNPERDFSNLTTSFTILRSKVQDEDTPVDKLIKDYIGKNKPSVEEVKMLYKELAWELTANSAKYKKRFGQHYYDLLLMAHNMVGNKTNRDEEIYACFKMLCGSLFPEKDARPGFISFYGIGHLSNLGNILQNDKNSPVQDQVIKIGMQYFDCRGGWSYQPETVINTGFDYMYAKKDIADLRALFFSNNWTIGIIPGRSCLQTIKQKYEMDGLIIFKEYGDRRMRSWKFD